MHTDGGTDFRRALYFLHADGVKMTTTTVHKPPSDGNFESVHGIILSFARTLLQQAKLPLGYRNYAIRHVADCKNFFPLQVTKRVPYEDAFGHAPLNIPYLNSFGYRMMYQPPVKILPTFTTRMRNEICLRHEGDGVCRVLTDTVIVRTKHVRSMETTFPDLRDIGNVNASTQSKDPIAIDLDSKFDSKHGDHSPGDEPTGSSVFEYIPSMEQKPDSDSDSLVADEDGDGNDDPDPDPQQEPFRPYNLCTCTSPNSSCIAASDTVTASDEPKVAVALKSFERDKRIQSIEEEFDTLLLNGTWTEVETVPRETRVLPSRVTPRIKHDANGNSFGSGLASWQVATFNPILWTTLSCTHPWRVSSWFAQFSLWRLPGPGSFTSLT